MANEKEKTPVKIIQTFTPSSCHDCILCGETITNANYRRALINTGGKTEVCLEI